MPGKNVNNSKISRSTFTLSKTTPYKYDKTSSGMRATKNAGKAVTISKKTKTSKTQTVNTKVEK